MTACGCRRLRFRVSDEVDDLPLANADAFALPGCRIDDAAG
jgi:hypothetical protein